MKLRLRRENTVEFFKHTKGHLLIQTAVAVYNARESNNTSENIKYRIKNKIYTDSNAIELNRVRHARCQCATTFIYISIANCIDGICMCVFMYERWQACWLAHWMAAGWMHFLFSFISSCFALALFVQALNTQNQAHTKTTSRRRKKK